MDDQLLSDTDIPAVGDLTVDIDDDLCAATLDFEYFMKAVEFEFDDPVNGNISDDDEDALYGVRTKLKSPLVTN